MSYIRIALSGKMTSGKSLVARHLVEKYQFAEYAFADKLKDIAKDIFRIKYEQKDERGRLVLQQLGQHMREIDPNVWVRYILKHLPSVGNLVVSDVRYPNEYQTLKDLGFIMVRMYVDRKSQEAMVNKVYHGLPLILLDDYSETALDKHHFDWLINNCESVPLEAVYRQVDALMGSLLLEHVKGAERDQ